MIEQKIIAPRVDANSDSLMFIMHRESGHSVKKGEVIATAETSKTALEIESPDTGVLIWSILNDQEVDVGQVLGTVRVPGDKSVTKALSATTEQIIEDIDIYQKFTGPALELINRSNINPELFEGVSLVTTKVIKSFSEKLDNQDDSEGLIANTRKSTTYLHPLIDSYDVPPTAGFQWREKLSECTPIPSSIDILEMLHKSALAALPGIASASIVAKTEAGELIISGAKESLPQNDGSDYKREVMRALAFEEEAMQADLVVSVLSHPTMKFSHTALLWPKSKITVAVAINEEGRELIFDATYDHRFLNGHLMMMFAEKSVDI